MAAAPRYNFEIFQGGTFSLEITIMDPDDTANELVITGWQARCAFRSRYGDEDEVFASTAVVTDGANGLITCEATATETGTIPEYEDSLIFTAEVESPTGRVVPALVGVATVVRSAIL